MAVSTETGPGSIATVRPQGRLDLLAAAAVKAAITATVAGGHCRLIVDLAAVTFMDSSGLGALIGGLRAARLAGGDLRLARPTEQIVLLLELTTLDRVLRPYATLAAALASYA